MTGGLRWIDTLTAERSATMSKPETEPPAVGDAPVGQEPARTRFAIESDQIMTSIGPTALAGGCFPGIAALVGAVIGALVTFSAVIVGTVPIDADLLSQSLGAMMGVIVFAVIGFVVGSIYAAIIAAAFSVVMITFHWTTNERFHPRILSHLVGGMTGFWCVAVLGLIEGTDLQGLAWVAVTATFAMLIGQYGAARGYQAMHRLYERESNKNDLQFGIRDLMVGMTWSAVLMALFAAAPGMSIVVFTCWVMVQAASFAAGESIRRNWIRNGKLKGM